MVPDMDYPRFTAEDVAGLRRSLAEWYFEHGVTFFHQAILMGQQAVRPPGPADRVAALMAASEVHRLRDGDLWYADESLCALVDAAHPTMPAFAPQPWDLPSQTGFALFAQPIAVYEGADARRDDVVSAMARQSGDDRIKRVAEELYAQPVSIIGVSWGPYRVPWWPAGGLWMSFYTQSHLTREDTWAGMDAKTVRQARAMLPPLTIDNEAALAWRPEGAPADTYVLHGGPGQDGTARWARLVFAAFRLAKQRKLAEQQTQRTPRPERRRTARAGLPERDVRVLRLRGSRGAARAVGGAGREWRHRWVVKGHWRDHWFPSVQENRPLWISPYVKGPGGAPLLGGDKVTVVSAPPERAEGGQA